MNVQHNDPPAFARVNDGPPPPRRKVGFAAVAEDIAKLCRSEPGRWVRVYDVPRSLASALRAGNYEAICPAKEWQIELRTYPRRHRGDLWLRYVGDEGED